MYMHRVSQLYIRYATVRALQPPPPSAVTNQLATIQHSIHGCWSSTVVRYGAASLFEGHAPSSGGQQCCVLLRHCNLRTTLAQARSTSLILHPWLGAKVVKVRSTPAWKKVVSPFIYRIARKLQKLCCNILMSQTHAKKL